EAASSEPIERAHSSFSTTLSDQQFLKGDSTGATAITTAGQLRIAQGSGRLSVVVLRGSSVSDILVGDDGDADKQQENVAIGCSMSVLDQDESESEDVTEQSFLLLTGC